MFKYLQITFLLSFFYSSGQINLISNPGFESSNGCPTFGGQWQFCNNWNNVNMNPGAGAWGTPDYFHTCGTGNTAPPATFSGTCTTQSGNAMMGLVMYNVPFPQYREYLSTQLACPMQVGSTYTLSFWLSNGTGIKSPWTIKNIGAHFSTAPLTQTGWNLINVIPQCEITTNVVSTSWTQYTFAITATTAWSQITIGCFRPDANNNPTLSFPNPGGPASSYANYFIDNIDLIGPSANTNTFTIASNVAQSAICGGTSSATITASNPTLNLTYTWTPGNFNTATASGLTAGVYTVTAGTGSGCNATTASTQFTVTQSTSLNASVNSPMVCKNTPAQLSATVSGGSPAYSYTWMPGNLNTPVINVSHSSTTVYTLSVKDNGGCASTLTTAINIDPITSNFNFNQNNCSGSFTLNNTSTGAGTYNWNFGDNTSSTGFQPQHTYSSPGTYSISLIANSNNGCHDTIQKTITVGAIVNSNFTAQLNICDTTVTLINNSVGGFSYLWRFGDGNTSTMQNPASHTYSTSGTFNIWLVVSNASGCKDSTQQTVSVIKNSTAGFNIISDPCLKQVSVSNTSSYAVTYDWQFGDGSISTSSSPTHTYLTTGNYSVTLIINAGLTCSASITKPVIINNGPIAQFTYSLSPCNGRVVFFNTSINGNGAYWSFGDNSGSYVNDPVHYYQAQGIYTVSLISSPNMPCLNTIKKIIEVKFNSVIADFDFTNPALTYNANFINLSKNAQTFFWDFYDGNSSTEFEPTHTYEQVGSYTVCLAAINYMGCTDTLCKKIDVDAGWTFYVPNTFSPNDDKINDTFYAYGTNIKDFKISVFDRWGEEIFNSSEIVFGWNGTFRGLPVQDDIYIWKAEFNDLKNKNHSLTGHIQVIR